jgi:hypothetical protein
MTIEDRVKRPGDLFGKDSFNQPRIHHGGPLISITSLRPLVWKMDRLNKFASYEEQGRDPTRR